MKTPKISDIPASNIKFKPGDRLLAIVTVDLTRDQINKIIKSIQEFAGCEVRVFVLNQLETRLFLRRGTQITELTQYQVPAATNPSVANLNCSKVDLRLGDELVVFGPKTFRGVDVVKYWAGPDVDVLFVDNAPKI